MAISNAALPAGSQAAFPEGSEAAFPEGSEAAFPEGLGEHQLGAQTFGALGHAVVVVEHVAVVGAEAAAGAGLGVGLAKCAVPLMHRLGLRWSWAAVSVPPTLLIHDLLGWMTVPVAAAELVIAVKARRRHGKDLDDVHTAAEARARRGPLDALRSLIARRRARRELAAGRSWRGGRLLIGHGAGHRPVRIPLGGPAGGTHTLVLGATGSGKTVTMSRIISGAVQGAMAAIVIDPKGDRALRENLRRAAMAAGRDFVEWSPTGPSIYNPYARGSASEIADKALAGEHYTEPHYLRQAQRYLGNEIRALRAAGLEVSLGAIVRHLDPGELELLLRILPEEEAREGLDYLDSLSPRQLRDLTGVRDRLAILAESDVGAWLDSQSGAGRILDLLEAIRGRAVVYFSLEADRRPLVSGMLAAAIVQDLLTAVAALQEDPVPVLLAIDEFSAIVPERVVRLFARGRSAGMSILLVTQEFADMSVIEGLREQILGNLSVLVAHRQVLPESARIISDLAGSRLGWSASHSSSGVSTHKRVREPVLAAERLRELEPGVAAVLELAGQPSVQIARIAPPSSPASPR